MFVCPADDHYYPPLSNLFYTAPGPLRSPVCVCACVCVYLSGTAR